MQEVHRYVSPHIQMPKHRYKVAISTMLHYKQFYLPFAHEEEKKRDRLLISSQQYPTTKLLICILAKKIVVLSENFALFLWHKINRYSNSS